MQKRSIHNKMMKLVGYILPPKKDNANVESESEEEEEETTPEFLDMMEMDCVSSGGVMFERSVRAAGEGIKLNSLTHFI